MSFSEKFKTRFSALSKPFEGFPSSREISDDVTRLRAYREHLAYLQKAHETLPPMIFTTIGGIQVVVD